MGLHPGGGQSHAVSPGLRAGARSVSLWRAWLRGWSAASASLQMAPSWAGVLVGLRAGGSAEGLGRLHRWAEATVRGSTRLSAGPCPWVTATPRSATGWGRAAGQGLGGKGLGVLAGSRLGRSQQGAQVARKAGSVLAGV